MDKLIHGEASRIINVLDDALLSFELLSLIPLFVGNSTKPQAEADREWKDLVTALEDGECFEVLSSLKALKSAELRYLNAKRANAREQVAYAAANICETTKQLCKNLRRDSQATNIISNLNAEIVENYRKQKELEEEEKGEYYDERVEEEHKDNVGSKKAQANMPTVGDAAIEQLSETLGDFKERVVSKLTTSLEQSQVKGEFYQEVQFRIRELENTISNIKDELTEESQKALILEMKKEKQDNLFNKIEGMKASFERDMAQVSSTKTKRIENLTNENFERREKDLEAFDTESEEFLQGCIGNSEKEEQLRKKFNRACQEFNDVVERYDNVMIQKKKEYDAISQRFESEQRRLAFLEQHFKQVDHHQAMVEEDERRISQEIAKLHETRNQDHTAAARIQAIFRGKKTRASRARGTKKKGKKSKKKKK